MPPSSREALIAQVGDTVSTIQSTTLWPSCHRTTARWNHRQSSKL